MTRTLLLTALVLLHAGCATHTVRQSTMFATPSAGPPQTSHGRADVLVGGSGTTLIDTSSRAPSASSGRWLTRGQLDGQLAVRINRFVSVRAAGFVGIPEGAVAPDPTLLERPGWVVFGGGPIAAFGYAAEDEPFFARLELGTLLSFFPSVLLVTPIDPEGGGGTVREEHYSFMPVLHGGLAAGYWVTDFFAFSGGVVFRNQPRPSFRDEFGVTDSAAYIDFGDLVAVPWIAGEFEIEESWAIVLQVQLPIVQDVLFGPTLSIGVRGLIGDGPTSVRRRREPPPIDESRDG